MEFSSNQWALFRMTFHICLIIELRESLEDFAFDLSKFRGGLTGCFRDVIHGRFTSQANQYGGLTF